MSAIDKIISQLPMGNGAASKKEEYIEKIVKKLELCNDIPLLDLIEKLLAKNL